MVFMNEYGLIVQLSDNSDWLCCFEEQYLVKIKNTFKINIEERKRTLMTRDNFKDWLKNQDGPLIMRFYE